MILILILKGLLKLYYIIAEENVINIFWFIL